MHILITTFGTSWQIVPELFGFTNPEDFPFFAGNEECTTIRERYGIKPVDELWLVSPENNEKALQPLCSWAKTQNVQLKIIVCHGVSELQTEKEILEMRSCIYASAAAAVQRAHARGGCCYLSLAGGRKTMSADMQDAGYLFGCDAIFHIIDAFPAGNKEIRSRFNADSLTASTGEYSRYFLPVVINRNIPKNFILMDKSISYPPVQFTDDNRCLFCDGSRFALKIQQLKDQSSNLYRNFSESLLMKKTLERPAFHKLSFLDPEKIHRLKATIIGKDKGKSDKEKDMALLKKLPKAELHSHLGGVLSSTEIIETAEAETNALYMWNDIQFTTEVRNAIAAQDVSTLNSIRQAIFLLKKNDFKQFYAQLLTFIKLFRGAEELFDTLLFGVFRDPECFYKIGLPAYQQLGDFQGSSLLQTKSTITKALELYVRKLREDNVRYVEIRCSPYKYTRLGLSAEAVTDSMINALDAFTKQDANGQDSSYPIEYRLILIVGRDADEAVIKRSIDDISRLYRQNPLFAQKIAGIDLAGTESKNLPQNLREAFMPLLEYCVSITIHAGETESVESIWQAVYHLTADRIGHGLRLLDKEELIDRFLYKNIGIEMCPSSNDQIVGFSKETDRIYPLKRYMHRGLKVTVNTDDCGISRTGLSEEFYKAACLVAREHGEQLTVWDCLVLIRNSISAAFVDKKVKACLMRHFEEEIFKLCDGGALV